MKKICLISFYFRPYKGVGALRLSYWYDRLKNDGYDVTVFSATPCDEIEVPSIIRLPERRNHSFIFKDSSFTWGMDNRDRIKQYLNNNIDAVILISGGPFLHFLPLLTLKKSYKNSRWILDYRDPLSKNPRNNSKNFIGIIKFFTKCIYEKIINSYADKIITVNDVCKSMILSDNVDVIDNGFDERYFTSSFDKNDSDKIVYAGKTNYFYSIKPLLDALENLPESYTFDYIGPDILPISSNRIFSHGFCNYEVTAELLKKSSIGVILATGNSFESTTKVFDYFAAKLKILIITQGEPMTGTLHEITKNNPNVEWARDAPEEIKSAILKLKRQYIPWDCSSYSRDFGYGKLKSIIGELS